MDDQPKDLVRITHKVVDKGNNYGNLMEKSKQEQVTNKMKIKPRPNLPLISAEI